MCMEKGTFGSTNIFIVKPESIGLAKKFIQVKENKIKYTFFIFTKNFIEQHIH